ncbi:nuclear transport factor 2 family protein [Ruegeria sp. 2205SS24-7]|uniref:nuclear transport factor 2 family protein n=1 Tax=Ruegeria discodermiae TaxID=3064389 RepID=UPI0027411EB7|nr:nuclear transport factor 2 family protein [Ruegeria sp. 2205SS24-7]MDP5220080.1 nuclear transport factor 2 family protein [Ruegeria sp. 2205SS24-7]
MVFTQEQFKQYESEFNNATDKSAFFDKYYDPDATFIHPYKGTFKGKEQLVGFWNSGKYSGHDGIHEILHLKNFISVENKLAVELDIEWRCLKDTNYLGARKAGDVFWGYCAAFYDLRDGKIVKVSIYLNLANSDDQTV